MPKLLCKCGNVIKANDIPNPNQYMIISDTDFEKYSEVKDLYDLYIKMTIVLKCSACHRLWIFWDGFSAPPQPYLLEIN